MMKEEQLDAKEIEWSKRAMTSAYRSLPEQARNRLEDLAARAVARAPVSIEPVFK